MDNMQGGETWRSGRSNAERHGCNIEGERRSRRVAGINTAILKKRRTVDCVACTRGGKNTIWGATRGQNNWGLQAGVGRHPMGGYVPNGEI
jgi:hypothetical protein